MGTMEKLLTALGTVNYIAVSFEPESREEIRHALDLAEDYLNDMDDRLSVFKPNSEISRINRNAGRKDTRVSADTFELLRLSKGLGAMTGGTFDITTKPLADAGRQGARIDYRDILLDRDKSSVRLRHRGQGIHLGGIAKGYAVDRVAAILKRQGVKNAEINLGGTVRNIGQSRRVGIRHPFAPDRLAASLESTGEAVVTSGLYERGSHIFDPVSGRPAQTDLVSATVIGSDGAAADAAATACMVLGMERSAGLLSSLGLEGFFIGSDGGVFATEHIRSRIQITQ